MNAKDKFEATKIKMVMKLKKLKYRAAVAEIAKCNAQHAMQAVSRCSTGEMASAEEFFKED